MAQKPKCDECVYKRLQHNGHCFKFNDKPIACDNFVPKAKLRESTLKPKTKEESEC